MNARCRNPFFGSSRVAILVGVAACASTQPSASIVSLSNQCKTNSDCGSYQQLGNATCSNGACIAFADRKDLARFSGDPYGSSSPLTLLVSVPDTESFGVGSTLILNSADLELGGPGSDPCVGPLTTNTCIAISGTQLESGDFETDPRTAEEVGRILNTGNPHTSLPSHATFRLLTSDVTTLTTRASTGLPVMPVYGTVGNHFSSGLSVSPVGPGGTLPITWLVNLQPGRYQREITVDPPFNDAFPPWRDVITIDDNQPPPAQLLLAAATSGGTPIDPQTNRTFSIQSPGTGVSLLTGWKTFIRDSTSGRILSSTTTFSDALGKAAAAVGGSGVSVVLNTVSPVLPSIATPTDSSGTELVLQPPPNVAWPTLVQVALGGSIPKQQKYPTVPIPAVVRGVINFVDATSGTATPVPSWIDFVSIQGDPNLQLAQGDANVDLRYRTSVHTASDGSYAVQLPRGAYNVVVTPDPGTGYAALIRLKSTPFTVAESTPGTTDADVQSGKGFSVSAMTPLAGHVTLTDGRPIGGIEIEARPSLSQTAPSELLPLMPVQRSASTTTDANGFYSMGVDPGTYDIFAKAPASSGFAWGVTTSHPVGQQPVVVDLEVPVPIDASMRIYETSTSTLAGALVRAYVPAGPNQAQIQVGEGTTDSNGVLTLFLSPELPK